MAAAPFNGNGNVRPEPRRDGRQAGSWTIERRDTVLAGTSVSILDGVLARQYR